MGYLFWYGIQNQQKQEDNTGIYWGYIIFGYHGMECGRYIVDMTSVEVVEDKTFQKWYKKWSVNVYDI